MITLELVIQICTEWMMNVKRGKGKGCVFYL